MFEYGAMRGGYATTGMPWLSGARTSRGGFCDEYWFLTIFSYKFLFEFNVSRTYDPNSEF